MPNSKDYKLAGKRVAARTRAASTSRLSTGSSASALDSSGPDLSNSRTIHDHSHVAATGTIASSSSSSIVEPVKLTQRSLPSMPAQAGELLTPQQRFDRHTQRSKGIETDGPSHFSSERSNSGGGSGFPSGGQSLASHGLTHSFTQAWRPDPYGSDQGASSLHPYDQTNLSLDGTQTRGRIGPPVVDHRPVASRAISDNQLWMFYSPPHTSGQPGPSSSRAMVMNPAGSMWHPMHDGQPAHTQQSLVPHHHRSWTPETDGRATYISHQQPPAFRSDVQGHLNYGFDPSLDHRATMDSGLIQQHPYLATASSAGSAVDHTWYPGQVQLGAPTIESQSGRSWSGAHNNVNVHEHSYEHH